MTRHEHPTDKFVRRLPFVSDEEARLLSDPHAKKALFQEIIMTTPVDTVEPSITTARTRAPRRRVALAATIALLSLTAVAGAWALFSSESTSVGCHLADGGVSVVDAVTGDPVVDCGRVWEQETGTVPPPLVAYDNGSGGIEVIPAAEAAPGGWQQLEPGIAQDPALIELEAALDDMAGGLSADCYLLREARQVAEAELDRLDLGGWTVTATRGEADGNQTCTYFYLDADRSEVVLIPLPFVAPPQGAPFTVFAEELDQALADDCLTVGDAAELARQIGADAGLGGAGLVIHEVIDESACTRADINVGGTVEATLRGPSS